MKEDGRVEFEELIKVIASVHKDNMSEEELHKYVEDLLYKITQNGDNRWSAVVEFEKILPEEKDENFETVELEDMKKYSITLATPYDVEDIMAVFNKYHKPLNNLGITGHKIDIESV